MNEEVASSEAQALPDSASSPAPRPAVSGAGLPPWLPLAALAVVPALIVGILVFILAGGDSGGGGGSHAAGILEGFLRPTEDSNTQVQAYKDRLPPDFPSEFPLYRGLSPVVAVTTLTAEGTTHRVVLTTSASADEVFAYYQDALDKDPWQIEVGQSSSEGTGVQYSRPDNADVSGVVFIQESELDKVTTVQLIYQDVSAVLTPGTGASNFKLGQSRPLPPGYPQDIPVYEANSGTVILDTGFQRAQGGQVFAVSFLTKDSQDDVIKFYTSEFGGRGWTTTDTSPGGTSFAVSIEFADKAQTLSGSVSADSFPDDSAYTKVELVVQVTSGRRGN